MSCMEDANHGFLAIIYSWFMDLDNPFKGVVHNLLIEGITCLGHQVKAPTVCALPCMVTLLETLDYLFVTPQINFQWQNLNLEIKNKFNKFNKGKESLFPFKSLRYKLAFKKKTFLYKNPFTWSSER